MTDRVFGKHGPEGTQKFDGVDAYRTALGRLWVTMNDATPERTRRVLLASVAGAVQEMKRRCERG